MHIQHLEEAFLHRGLPLLLACPAHQDMLVTHQVLWSCLPVPWINTGLFPGAQLETSTSASQAGAARMLP